MPVNYLFLEQRLFERNGNSAPISAILLGPQGVGRLGGGLGSQPTDPNPAGAFVGRSVLTILNVYWYLQSISWFCLSFGKSVIPD